MKKLHQQAFTLLEILLASVIFVVSVGGVFITLNSMRRPVADKESALTAAVFGKQVLDALRSQVDARSYYTPCASNPCTDFSLALGPHQVTASLPNSLVWPQAIAAENKNILSYTVSCSDGSADNLCGADVARRVDLDIKWPDAL